MDCVYKDLQQELEDCHKAVIKKAFFRGTLNVSKTAIGMSMSRNTLTRYLIKYWGTSYKQIFVRMCDPSES